MTSAGLPALTKLAIAYVTKERKLKMKTDYSQGFDAGKESARKEIVEMIELHINSNVELSDQEIVREIEYLRQIDKENGL